MTERIKALKSAIVDQKTHHAYRRDMTIDPACYRRSDLKDYQRTALRLKTFLDSETPVILDGENISFLRTLPDLPVIYTDEEWAAITKTHYIHEQGRVCNLSADYGKIIARGLNAVLAEIDAADDGSRSDYYDAMRMSLRAVLDLTARYARKAREIGRDDIADVLDKVPAQPAETLREALQSLRVLHFAMWCEGDYHNTLGRFDQYMYPYYRHDVDAGILTRDEAAELITEFFLAGGDATACVKSTSYNMAKAGYTVHILSDCITSYDKKKIDEMLAYYQSKGCLVEAIADIIRETE